MIRIYYHRLLQMVLHINKELSIRDFRQIKRNLQESLINKLLYEKFIICLELSDFQFFLTHTRHNYLPECIQYTQIYTTFHRNIVLSRVQF